MDGFDFDDFAGGVSGENPFAEGETADASGKRLLSSPRGDVYYWVTRCLRDEAGWMVLLHGAAMDHTVFDGIAGWLSEKYNLIVPDLPLHGLSEEYGEFSFDACAYDVRDILNNEHADRAAVLGHCIGGCAAQAFAAAFPEYCAGLILADTFPFGNELYGYADLSFFERAAGILRVMPARAFALALSQAFACTSRASRQLADVMRAQNTACAVDALLYSLTELHGTRAPDFAAPVMYVVGNNDRLGGIRELNRKAAEISGNRLYVVENAGHTPYLDNREGFLSAIKGFLDEEN